MKNIINSKLPNVGTNIFSSMSKLAIENKAINLSQGYPDFEVDPFLIKLVNKYMNKGINQYAPMQGAIRLREAISEKIESIYHQYYDINEEITITAGATQAIFTTIAAFIHPKDEVIIFSPAFDCYQPAVELNGGVPVFIELEPSEFKIDWKKVEKKISSKTRMIIINNPHNPLGTIFTEHDMKCLENISQKYNTLILSDEVYEHLVYDKNDHISICKYPKLFNNAIATFSFGKTFHITGWKLGYVLAPKHLMIEIRKVHQFNIFSCNHPIQLAIADYLQTPDHYLSLNSFYQEKRDLFLEIVSASRFKAIPCKGTYFQLLNYSNISVISDTEMAKKLTISNGIASIPISVFSFYGKDDQNLRFCFAKKVETLKRAGDILIKI